MGKDVNSRIDRVGPQLTLFDNPIDGWIEIKLTKDHLDLLMELSTVSYNCRTYCLALPIVYMLDINEHKYYMTSNYNALTKDQFYMVDQHVQREMLKILEIKNK